ncbi:hypothetical protein LQ938_05170 [Microbacterium sp. cx-55]|uniref:DUF6578 domain-containing protein n=1 Tax=Microbacterium sp. cx-55 TaxID=2875948 RepID=UPI001CBBD3EB|nr:DUF6578 domain-containing protein [Microbacterium sp. cx-55]MBZ4488603.1 hypothetical protein [Microbacterium sp. cx-55]UGB36181.1 hypothetical protein LQ938_05170 [Microbacterium sp. cx-55]
MTRLWLTNWEWSCCGDAFAVGDEVDFGIFHRGPDEWLRHTLGVEIAGSVDAVESHHEELFPDRVRGRVTAIHAVTQEYVERQELRRPGHGAPPDSDAPLDGEEWTAQSFDLGAGVFAGMRPSRFITVSEPVPGKARLRARPAVPSPGSADWDPDDGGDPGRVSSPGWLVDVDER